MNFAAPVMANEQLNGCFIGGQVLTEASDSNGIKRIAEDIRVNPEKYLEAAGFC